MPEATNDHDAQLYTDARLTRDMTGLAKQLEKRADRQPPFANDVDLALAGRRLFDALAAVVDQ